MARRLQLCEGGVEVCEKLDDYGDGGRSEEGVCEQRDTGDFELARESDAFQHSKRDMRTRWKADWFPSMDIEQHSLRASEWPG